mmetsp:Transcript_5518/g.10929  ORF Transcript_5518/g.10929 Transcript_5518/m.10929 type:complete len:94 (-) Transcript_5518:671-952(-)
MACSMRYCDAGAAHFAPSAHLATVSACEGEIGSSRCVCSIWLHLAAASEKHGCIFDQDKAAMGEQYRDGGSEIAALSTCESKTCTNRQSQYGT